MFRPSPRSQAAGTRPEWALLFCSARSVVDAGHSERIRDLAREHVDWHRLVELATRHRVAPLVYRSLNSVCPDAVPPATLGLLERKFSSNVARNLALTSELLELLKSLAALEVPAIPFKGPTLASRAYGGLALREAGDLDVLVRRRDAIKSRQMLISRGFRPYLGRAEADEFERSYHFMLVRDERPMTIEIHWRLIGDRLCFDLSEESLWRGPSSTRVAGVDVPCLPTPELLIYLCAHGAKHCWQRLSWICDIAELVRVEPDIDWDLVMAKARVIGAQRMLSLGLLLAVDILGAPLAHAIVRTIRADAAATGLAREVLERYFREIDRPPEFAEMWRFNLRARERRRDRLRCRKKLMAPAFAPNKRDIAFLHLPPRLSLFYHAVKPVRLASQFASNPTRLLRLLRELLGLR